MVLLSVGCVSAAASMGCSSPANQPVAIVLDVPNGPLEPTGAATVALTLHSLTNNDSIFRTANISASGAFDVGDIPKTETGRLEAAMRSESGALVGYGRSVEVVKFDNGGEAVVPVRRPMLYLGTGKSTFTAPNGSDPETGNWEIQPTVVADFSPGGTPFNGTRLTTTAGYLVAAAGTIYGLQQSIDASGVGTGAVTLVEIKSEDHTVGAPRTTGITGDVREAVGSDDGEEIAVATADGAWLVHVATGATDRLATGPYDRITIRDIGADNTKHEVIVLSSRVGNASNCTATAKLERITITGDTPNKTLIAMGPISDITTANGRVFFSNVCTGKISEVTATATTDIRMNVGHPTNIVASDTQIWFSELRDSASPTFAISSLVLSTNDPPRLLWQTPATLLLVTSEIQGVQRILQPDTAELDELTLISNEFVGLRTRTTYDEPRLTNLPRTAAESDITRVILAGTGAVVTEYQSWCKVLQACSGIGNDVCGWSCANTGAQRPSVGNEHRIRSLAATFQRR